MKQKILIVFIILLITFISNSVFAYEDCIISTDGKMTDIKIQHNDIIDVFPLITIMNDKNTIIVHPLKQGKTKFCILKDQKEKYFFDVEVKKETTIVSQKEGFDIFTVDCPPIIDEFDFILDKPPSMYEESYELDTPPILRKEASTFEE